MRSLETRFLLPFGLVAALSSAFLIYEAYVASRQHAHELVGQQAALALQFNLAIREYAAVEIRPVMERLLRRDDFLPETMSTSFISRRIFEGVRKEFPDLVIRFASDQPRNPVNAASPDERRMIEYFQRNPQVPRRVEEIQIGGEQYLAHFAPKWVEPECLRCHGEPRDAPASLLQRYGQVASFHRRAGDVAGLDTVAVRLERVQTLLASDIRRQWLTLAAGLAVLFGTVVVTFRSAVTQRLTAMASHFHAVAAHTESQPLAPVEVVGNDEIAVLGRAFNTLVEELCSTQATLEQRVEQRTAELARANLELKREIVERQRAEAAVVEHSRQLESVRSISAEITRELDLPTVLRLITQRACELTGAVAGNLALWDEERQVLLPQVSYGSAADRPKHACGLGEGAMGTVAQSRVGLMLNDYRLSPPAPPSSPQDSRVTASLLEPLLYGDRLLGVIGVDHETPGRGFTAGDQATLRLFAAQAAIAIENARLFDRQQAAFADLHRAQDELVRAAKLRALGQMATGIAHDLNNMLAAILGQVEILKLRGTPPEVREGLDVLQTAATDGAHVVRRLQDFARQRVTSSLAAMDLGRVVQEAVEITRPRWKDEAQRRGQRIELRSVPGELPRILGNASEVREVLTNLIFNAVDALSDGGTLTFAGEATAEEVVLRVMDSGAGMTEEVQQKLFEPFFTTKGVRGMGLGLSVAYGIMERHGGRIDVASAPGRGTTVTLRFQRAPDGAAAPAAPPAFRAVARRILLIDDEPVVRQTLAGLLGALGHEVVEAEGGAAGLAALAARPADLVLTDLGMPGMTGWEVARAVRARYPGLPILLLTGWGEQAAESGGDRGLVDRILGKPVELEELLEAIATLSAPPPAG